MIAIVAHDRQALGPGNRRHSPGRDHLVIGGRHHPGIPGRNHPVIDGRVGTRIAPRPPHRSGLASFSHPAPPEFQPVASADFALVERVAIGIGNGKIFIKRLNRSHVMPR
jgi:hypothetical protein